MIFKGQLEYEILRSVMVIDNTLLFISLWSVHGY